MKATYLIATVAAVFALPISVLPVKANGGFRPVNVAPGGSAPTRGFHSSLPRAPHAGLNVVRPVFVPFSVGYLPQHHLRRQNVVINNTVIFNQPRRGIPTVTELPVVMGIRRAPSADPVFHQVDRSFSVTSLRTHQHSSQRWRGQRDPGTGSPIQFQRSGSVSTSIVVFRSY